MKKITQNLYYPILNALLISSLTTLTACGGSGGDDNNHTIINGNGDQGSDVTSPVDGGNDNNGGNTGSDNGGNSGSDNGGDSGSDNGGNSGSDNGGNSGSDNGGDSGSDNGGNSGSDNGGNSGSDNGGNSVSDNGGNSSSDNGGNSGSDNGGNSGSDNGGDSGSDNGGTSGNDNDGDNNNNEPEVIKDTVISLSVAEDGDMFSGKPYVFGYTIAAADGSNGANISPEFNIEAKYGTFTKTHPQTGKTAPDGKLFYYVPESVLGTTPDYYYFTEVITVTNAAGVSKSYNMKVGTESLNGDPVFTDQWHIKNLGQNPFKVRKAPVAGVDLNVIPAWHLTDDNNELISGKNVKVGVWDAIVDFNHEDLASKKYNPTSTGTFINATLSLNSVKQDSGLLHGTMVAGIIGAEANNGKGVRGIAYGARLASYDANKTNLYYLARKNDLDIVNASLGLDNSYAYQPSLEAIYQGMFENNVPLIKAAGNEFYSVTFNNSSYYPNQCSTLGISCQFNQSSSFNRGRYLINVAAINSLGKKSSYSTAGAHLWVSGTGGEFGYTGGYDSSAAIVTTKYSYDPSSYDDGLDGTSPWRKDSSKYDIRKYYTHIMNGTSSATPSVTGVSSLVIQAKPDITVPQLRYILATTANNDTAAGWSSLKYGPQTSNVSEYGQQITFDRGWHDTAAGLRFSNYYGFGVVDAKKAVTKALACDSDVKCAKRAELPDDYRSTGSKPCSSSDGGKTVTCQFTNFVNTDNSYDNNANVDIEVTTLNLASFTYANDSSNSSCSSAYNGSTQGIAYANNLLQIEMTSPNGTKALLKPVYANWDFDGKALRKALGSSDYSNPFLVNVSEFFTEKVSAKSRFTVNFKSKCPIDVDALNSSIYVMIGGYAD